MPNRSWMTTLLSCASLLALSAAFDAVADGALSIDAGDLQSQNCFGKATCALEGASVTASGGVLAKKADKGETAFGVSGGPSGSEIDIGQVLRVDYDEARSIIAIKIVFLYNGPEFGDRAEKARITADGIEYVLSVRNNYDDAAADWSGPGVVSKCGPTTSAGSGCFVITDPFPGVVSRLDFTAAPGGPPAGGSGTNESDYAIGFIDAGAEAIVNLGNCADPSGCPVAAVGGSVAASLSLLQATHPTGAIDVNVIPLRYPDCRYIPKVCVDLLPPIGDAATSDDAARSILIGLGVIKPLVSWGSDKLNPAVQLLNVTPLLPPEVTSQFDSSGKPPTGLPPMYLSSRARGQVINQFWIDGLFFVMEPGVVFTGVFEGLIDVDKLTGQELGCEPVAGNLLAWDMITSVSERSLSVGGRYIDRLLNVGCINPTKISDRRLSLYSVNLEGVTTTYGPTIKSWLPKITTNNDAYFARLVQSLWFDLGEVKARYVCKASGAPPPLGKAACDALHSLWDSAEYKIRSCVNAAFYPASASGAAACASAKERIEAFEAALPGAATGPDPDNRVSELQARVDTVQHVWERFLLSLKPGGFCREKGTCPP